MPSGLDDSEFDVAGQRVAGRVGRFYLEGNDDRIFNGKWYVRFLAADAERVAGLRPYLRKNLDGRLVACLLATLDFSGPWPAGLCGQGRDFL